MTRGYFGIACFRPKTTSNVGTLWRSAHVFGASFLAVIGERYRQQASDTTQATRHVPLLHFDTFEALRGTLDGCTHVAVERVEGARALPSYTHPERACYVLGPEDGSLPESVLSLCTARLIIPGAFCLNLAVAGSIVAYDRIFKRGPDAT